MKAGSDRWGRSSIIAEGTTPDDFINKNWMVINHFPESEHQDRLAIAYAVIIGIGNFHVSPLSINLSDNKGQSWTASHLFGPPISKGVQPFFFPDGSLGAVYINDKRRIEYIFSPDGGTSFETPSIVTPYQTHDDPVARDGTWMSNAIVNRQSGALFVVYQGVDDSSKPCVFFTRSIDKGQTWSAPITINDTPNDASIFNPAIAVSPDGQHVTVAFYDKRDSNNDQLVHLYLAESFDGGDSWIPNQRISQKPTNLRFAPLTSKGRMIGDYHGIVPSL